MVIGVDWVVIGGDWVVVGWWLVSSESSSTRASSSFNGEGDNRSIGVIGWWLGVIGGGEVVVGVVRVELDTGIIILLMVVVIGDWC